MCVFILYLFTEKNQKTKQLLIKVVTYTLSTQLYMQLIDCSTRNMYNVRYKKYNIFLGFDTISITYADGYKYIKQFVSNLFVS